MRNLIVLITVCFISSGVCAAPEYNGKVERFYLNSSGLYLLKLDSGSPACGDSSWPFQYLETSTTAKSWTSMLMLALASGKNINIGYTPNSGGRCGIVYIYFKD